MSSTAGVQNYLSNVFRPVYTFDTTTTLFTPKLELSNIDTYSGNSLSVFTIAVGDSNSNVYVGSNAGNRYDALRNCSNVTALGVDAGKLISNVSNSVYIGYNAGGNAINSRSVISIGAGAGGGGSSNLFVGTGTGTIGSSNILIGHAITPSNVSNQIKIGLAGKIPIAADLSTNWVGLGGFSAPVHLGDGLDISGTTYILGAVGINTMPGVDGTLDVNGNFNTDDGAAYLRFRTTGSNSEVTLSNYTGGTGLLNVVGSTQSSEGYWSVRGTALVEANSVTIGILKKGIIHVSVLSTTQSTECAARSMFASTLTTAVDLGSNYTSGNTTITLSGSNIQITNPSDIYVYAWSITYFPLP